MTKYLIEQLETSKLRIKDLFNNILNETKGLKYEITLKVTWKKYKPNRAIELRPVYFNSTTKTVINYKFSIENAFQEVLYRTDNWINEGSGWIVELTECQYINISTYRPLSWSSYVQLPVELKSPKKGLIKIKNNDQKYFLWCHVRHINPVKIHSEKIIQNYKKLANDLDYKRVGFSKQEENFSKIETKNNICINVFCDKNSLTFPTYILNQKRETLMVLLLVTNENKSYYVYIKDFNGCMFQKTKNKNKKYYCKSCLQCFSSNNVLTEHR